MNEPLETVRGTRYFLVNHGVYYGKEILNGVLFIPQRDALSAEWIAKVQAGDVFFQVSDSGLSAVGKALHPCRITSYPAWRYAEAPIGEKGYTLDVQSVLLAEPLPPTKPLHGYLTPISESVAERLIWRLAKKNPYLSAFLGVGSCTEETVSVKNP